jgi:hypothetical protein
MGSSWKKILFTRMVLEEQIPLLGIEALRLHLMIYIDHLTEPQVVNIEGPIFLGLED